MQTGSKISILGCGWLGLPLALRFMEEGYQVKGSTTSPARLPVLAQQGILPSLINLQDSPSPGDLAAFIQADVLVVSFPPGLRSGKGEAYLQQIKQLSTALQQATTPRILFISSTSVYPERNQVVREAGEGCDGPGNHILYQAERMLAALPGKTVTAVYLAGLVGGNRHPGRFLAGKTDVPNPLAPVNLIHQDDCVEILYQIVRQQQWPKRFNACADAHPCREEFYTAAALSLGLTPPGFAAPDPADSFKIISNEQVKQELNYVFKFPDPMCFF
jgi:nucleoside-diphosphate-sugar epimerase